MRIFLHWVTNALALSLTAWLLLGIEVDSATTALIAVALIALVNIFIKPFLVLLTLPINILTLGLFTLVINGLCFWFVASFTEGFEVRSGLSAILGALVYSIVSYLLFRLLVKRA
jgi:putative membrane protein